MAAAKGGHFCQVNRIPVYRSMPLYLVGARVYWTNWAVFNERAREDRLAVRNKSGGHLAVHCMRCQCDPLSELTKFIKRANKKTEREIVEAYSIKSLGDNCVSLPSIFC
uniref:Putative tick transposon n=1 Tax=Ixodes ricinus TaxID=34613 RepID=A0A6B0UIQ6_IXORI